MLQRFKDLFGGPVTRPVFVIGTGRSGTHWLGYSLGSHREVRATVERRPMFSLSTRMALDASLEDRLLWRLVAVYRWQLLRSPSPLYLDKSHPNIWIAEKLKAAFPQALFVGIERNPYATVASMLRHRAVLAWHVRWREFPVPNRFLGITPELARSYDSVPLPSRCAMRWVAHRDRMSDLRGSLGDDLMVISYESFARDAAATLSELQVFLGLRDPIPMPDVNVDSLDKWRSQLSDEEIRQIRQVVGPAPEM